jgi:hypothetical protein
MSLHKIRIEFHAMRHQRRALFLRWALEGFKEYQDSTSNSASEVVGESKSQEMRQNPRLRTPFNVPPRAQIRSRDRAPILLAVCRGTSVRLRFW